MAKYLVRVEPDKTADVKTSLSEVNIPVIRQVFDYLVIDIPEEAVPRVRAIPHVVEVRKEKAMEIKAIPVEKKLAEFRRLFWSNPVTGPPSAFAFSARADAGIERWPTGESREVLEADIAEREGYTGKGIKVAVIDTGGAPCPQGSYTPEKSSVEGQPIGFDENGHGLWCSSCINGGEYSTAFGVLKGVSPDTEVGVFKCLGYLAGGGTETSVMRALMDAYQWGASIISMSLGSSYSEESTENIPECRAIRMLSDAGVVVVVANGNDATEEKKARTVGVPACEPTALSVGAIDKTGARATFSSCGPTQEGVTKPDVSAPGVHTTSSTTGLIAFMQAGRDWPGTGSISGTSMSTPHVAGLMSIWAQYLKERDIKLTRSVIEDIITTYGKAKDNELGVGVPKYSWVKNWYGR